MKQIPKKVRILVGAALVLTLGFGGYDFYQTSSRDKGIYYGTVESKEYDICARTAGVLQDVGVSEGDAVLAGQVVARIETDDAKIRLDQSKAALGQVENELAGMTEGARDEEIRIQQYNLDQLELQKEQAGTTIAKMEAMVRQSAAALKTAQDTLSVKKDDYSTAKSLYEGGSASLDSLKKAKSAYEGAVNGVAISQEALSGVQSDLKNTRSQWAAMGYQIKSAEEKLKVLKSGATERTVKGGQMAVEQTRASVKLAEAALLKSSVTAMMQGTVQSINFDKGEYVAPGSPVVTIRDEKDLYMKIYVPEKALPLIQTGKAITVRSTAGGIESEGKVVFVAAKAMFTPSNIVTVKDREKLVFEVKIKVAARGKIKAGMLAEVRLK